MKYIFFLFISNSFAYSSTQFIAWGGTNSIVKPQIRENFLTGFQLGFESEFGRGSFEKYIKTYSDESDSKTSAIKIAKKAIDDGAIGLIGFPGSHDALLVGDVAREKSILSISPGCNHEDLGKFGFFVHSTGHSGTHEIDSSLWFIQKYFKGIGLVIVNPRAAASFNMGELFKKKSEKEIFQVNLNDKLQLPESTISDLKNGVFKYIVFTPYPDDLSQVTKQLTDSNIDLPTLAGSAWGTVDSDVMRRYVVSKKKPFYMMTSWNAKSTHGKNFIKKYKKSFAKEPSADSAYGYDLGVIVAQLLKNSKTPYTKESFSHSLKEKNCFSNLSIGQLCLNKNGGHATRPIFFLKYSSNGFVEFDVKN